MQEERLPMLRTCSVLHHSRKVPGSAVTFMYIETVLRKGSMHIQHQPIARYFGYNRCRGYARLRLIATHNGTVRKIEPERIATIHEQIQMLRILCHHCNSQLHCAFVGSQNSLRIYRGRWHNTYTPHAVTSDPGVGRIALRWSELLAVVYGNTSGRLEGKYACAGDNGAGYCASAGFIDTHGMQCCRPAFAVTAYRHARSVPDLTDRLSATSTIARTTQTEGTPSATDTAVSCIPQS